MSRGRTYSVNEIFYSLQGEGHWTGTPMVFVRFSACNLRCLFCDTDFSRGRSMTATEIVNEVAVAASSFSAGAKVVAASGDAAGNPASAAGNEARPDIGGALPPVSALAQAVYAAVPEAAGMLHFNGSAVSPYESGTFPGDSPQSAFSYGETRSGSAAVSSVHSGPGDDTVAVRVCLTGGEPGLQVDKALVEALHTAGFKLHVETNGTLPLPPGLDWITLSPKSDWIPSARLVLPEADELKLVYKDNDPAVWAGFPATYHYLQPCSCRNTAATIAYIRSHPLWQLSLQTHKYLGIR